MNSSIDKSLVCLFIFFSAVNLLAYDIHTAVRQGDPEEVKRILEKHPLLVNAEDKMGFTPLHIASLDGKKDIVDVLIEHGAFVRAAAHFWGGSVLHFAAAGGNPAIVRLLIEKGASVSARANGCATPLCWASSSAQIATARVLIEEGADVNAVCIEGWTPLYRAATSGNPDLVELLLENGSEVNIQCIRGFSPLHRAAQAGHRKIVEMLVSSGAGLEVKDNNGNNPLELALLNGYADAAAVLYEAGAESNINRLKDGKNLMHHTAISGYGDVMDILIKNGTDVNVEDKLGFAPVDLAARYGNKKVYDILRQNGAEARKEPYNFGFTPLLKQELKIGEGIIWKMAGNSYAVKTKNHFLIFDYIEVRNLPDEPCLANGHIVPEEIKDQNVLVFISSSSAARSLQEIKEWRKVVRNIRFVLGIPVPAEPNILHLNPSSWAKVEDVEVLPIWTNLNISGQSFLIKVDGLTLFMAMPWTYWEKKCMQSYRKQISDLCRKDISPDMAFLSTPYVDKKYWAVFSNPIMYTVEKLRPTVLFPISNEPQRIGMVVSGIEQLDVSTQIVYSENRGDHYFYSNGRVIPVDWPDQEGIRLRRKHCRIARNQNKAHLFRE